jgi:hypothetical protein
MLLNYGNNSDPKGATSNYMNDKLDPSLLETAGSGLAAGFASPFTAASNIGSDISGQAPDKAGQNLQEASDTFNDIASAGSGTASFVGNTVGLLVNPLSVVSGEGLGAAAGKVATGLLDYGVPQAAEKALTPTLSVTSAVSKAAVGTSAGAGVMFAPSVAANYDEATKKIDWGGVATGTAIGGALGLGVGAIPFAYGLLKFRSEAGLPITDAEKAFVDKPLGDKVSSQDSTNMETQKQAEDIVNSHVSNPSVTIDQGLVNSKLMEETDLGNIQSSVADMLSATGDVDGENLRNLATPALRPLLEDPQVMGALEQARAHIQGLHEDVSDHLDDVLAKRQKKLLPTLQKVLGFSDEQLEKYKAQDNGEFLKSVAKQKTLKGQTLLAKAIETAKESPEKFGKRTQQQLQEMQAILDTHEKLDHYNRTLDTIDTLNKLRTSLPADSDILKSHSNYMKKRVAESAPLPKVEPEEANTTTTQQKVDRAVQLSPTDSLDEESLPKNARGLREPLRETKKAIESLKKNNKVLSSLMKCVMGNK